MLLLEVTGTISLRPKRLTRAEAESLGGDAIAIMNLLNWRGFEKIEAAVRRWVETIGMTRTLNFKNFPKPNVVMKDYEAMTGLWVFDDTSGITFLVYTDEHRKNPWKGATIELVIPHELQREHTLLPDEVLDTAVSSALHRLFDAMQSY